MGDSHSSNVGSAARRRASVGGAGPSITGAGSATAAVLLLPASPAAALAAGARMRARRPAAAEPAAAAVDAACRAPLRMQRRSCCGDSARGGGHGGRRATGPAALQAHQQVYHVLLVLAQTYCKLLRVASLCTPTLVLRVGWHACLLTKIKLAHLVRQDACLSVRAACGAGGDAAGAVAERDRLAHRRRAHHGRPRHRQVRRGEAQFARVVNATGSGEWRRGWRTLRHGTASSSLFAQITGA